jgi:2-polyprenyl-6-methoxyphenol hydroxylase-like FAD-dependent oxidoreductase
LELVERNPTWHAVGAGFLVQANGMRVLHALGLGTAIEHAGAVVRWWNFCDEQGEVLCETDLKALWSDAGPCVGIERTKLQQVLLSGVAAVPCRLGTSITSLAQDNQRVSVTFTDSSACQYVVGADGIFSTVRRLALSTTSPADIGAMNWRSIAPIRPSGLTALQFMLGDGCFFGLCPVGEARTYGFGYIMQPRSRDPLRGDSSACATASPPLTGACESIWPHLNATSRSTARPWSGWTSMSGILVVSSSSATPRTSSPLMGQGGLWPWKTHACSPKCCAPRLPWTVR